MIFEKIFETRMALKLLRFLLFSPRLNFLPPISLNIIFFINGIPLEEELLITGREKIEKVFSFEDSSPGNRRAKKISDLLGLSTNERIAHVYSNNLNILEGHESQERLQQGAYKPFQIYHKR